MNDPKVIELYLGTLAAGQEKKTADAKAAEAAE